MLFEEVRDDRRPRHRTSCGFSVSLGISVLFPCLIAPLLILIRLDGFDYPATVAIAGTLLAASLLLALINVSQTRLQACLRTEG